MSSVPNTMIVLGSSLTTSSGILNGLKCQFFRKSGCSPSNNVFRSSSNRLGLSPGVFSFSPHGLSERSGSVSTSGTKLINPYAGSLFWAAIAETIIARVEPLVMFCQFHSQSVLRYSTDKEEPDKTILVGSVPHVSFHGPIHIWRTSLYVDWQSVKIC